MDKMGQNFHKIEAVRLEGGDPPPKCSAWPLFSRFFFITSLIQRGKLLWQSLMMITNNKNPWRWRFTGSSPARFVEARGLHDPVVTRACKKLYIIWQFTSIDECVITDQLDSIGVSHFKNINALKIKYNKQLCTFGSRVFIAALIQLWSLNTPLSTNSKLKICILNSITDCRGR